jgi:hypothetical protein
MAAMRSWKYDSSDWIMNGAVQTPVLIWLFHTSCVAFKQPVCQWSKKARKLIGDPILQL